MAWWVVSRTDTGRCEPSVNPSPLGPGVSVFPNHKIAEEFAKMNPEVFGPGHVPWRLPPDQLARTLDRLADEGSAAVVLKFPPRWSTAESPVDTYIEHEPIRGFTRALRGGTSP